jgi:hypothetical protein
MACEEARHRRRYLGQESIFRFFRPVTNSRRLEIY